MPTVVASSTLDRFTTFGDLLRFLRRRVGMTQIELANEVGYSDTQISRLEQNLRLPDIPTIETRFVPALGLENEADILARLLDLAANVRREDAPAPGLCPYKGLNYFDEADADLFFGREILNEQLVERVLALAAGAESGSQQFLAVVGASGSGKSSLVRAGLVASLRWHRTSADWHMAVFTPTAHPLESLAGTLLEGSSFLGEVPALSDDLAGDVRSLQMFARSRLRLGQGARLLLVVDQFEELFSLCHSEEERVAFIGNLLAAASDSDSPVIVVITLRADFYAHCAGYAQLREALARNQQYIGAMNDGELRRAIEEPAERGRWEFEPGLVDLLLYDVGHEPGALPLLSHALLETWQRRRGRTMTLGGYTSSQGVRGAIAETAETVFSDQLNSEQQAIARRIFMRLTEFSDEPTTTDTRRRATFNELILRPEEADDTHKVLKALADARLITTSEDSAEVAHEALIREWPTLRGWLEENRDSLRLHRQLTEAAQEWAESDRAEDALYRGLRLARAGEWAAAHESDLNVLEADFLAASLAESERDLSRREAQRQQELDAAVRLAEAEQRRAEAEARSAAQLRRRSYFLVGALALAGVALLAAVWLGARARDAAVMARQNERLASSRELAAAAVSNLTIDPERSILLALEAIRATADINIPSILPEAEEALHLAVLASHARQRLVAHRGAISGLAYLPDGTQLVTAGQDGMIRLWNTATLAVEREIRADVTGEAVSLALAPDGKLIAAGNSGGNVRIWEAASGKVLQSIAAHAERVTAVSFSPDGGCLMTGSEDGTTAVWDVATGLKLHEFGERSLGLADVATRPSVNGVWSATSLLIDDECVVSMWNNVSGESLFWVAGQGPLAFSPDGRTIATSVAESGSATIWDVGTGARVTDLIGNNDLILAFGWSPDNQRLATGGRDRAARIWDAASGRELLALYGHSAAITRVDFSPDGQLLATGDALGVVRLWDTGLDQEWFTLSGPAIPLRGLRHYLDPVFSPDGKRLYAAVNLHEPELGTINQVLAIDAMTGKVLQVVTANADTPALSLAMSPDGQMLAVGYPDGGVRVLDAQTGERLLALQLVDPVLDLAFSPDGQWLATAGSSSIQLFDTASGTLSRLLKRHSLHDNLTQAAVRHVAFSPDGQLLATASTDETVIVWSLDRRDELLTLRAVGALAVAFSPDGGSLATTQMDGSVKLWNATTGEQLQTLAGHENDVTGLAFAPDGTWLAVASDEGVLKVWDLATGTARFTLAGGANVAVSPDGKLVATYDRRDSTLRVYLSSIEDLAKLAESRLTRSLTHEECRQYLHLESCPAADP